MYSWECTPTYRGFDTFYGYYNSEEDYYSHTAKVSYFDPKSFASYKSYGLDLRHNLDAVVDQNEVYSTYLLTTAIQDAITSHKSDDKPFFIYGAYQAPHSPLEAPNKYLEMCSDISYEYRQEFCGMMKAVDEGILNITHTLESEGLLDNTVIIFSTDNGGDVLLGSSNLPLRGGKGNVFEGGVRGVAFVWGKMLSKTNYDYTGLMHITDWYRTIVEGIAGIELSEDVTEKSDSYNMWQALTQNEPSPRDEILIQLIPPRGEVGKKTLSYYGGEAALRSGDWKLITGVPTCDDDECPYGWVYLDGSIEEPPSNPSDIWLFNITADPNERNNLAEAFPEVVSRLMERIEYYNSTHIYQQDPPFDMMSRPSLFGGIWTPWIVSDSEE